VSRNGKNLQTSNEPKNDSFRVYILYRSHSRWWSLKSLTNTQKSTARLDTHGHDRVDLKNFDFSYEQLRKEICTTIFTNRIILSPRGQSIKRSTNKSKPLIIHFTYLYMIINCVSLFSRKGCCCVCVCVYVSVCVCVCWSDSQRGSILYKHHNIVCLRTKSYFSLHTRHLAIK
jgi:hypothetical protein